MAALRNELKWLQENLSMTDEERNLDAAYTFDYMLEDWLRETARSDIDPDDAASDPTDALTKLTKSDQLAFGAWATKIVSSSQTVEWAPPWMYFDEPELVDDGWLVHFSDRAEDIVQEGFRIGVDDISMLAYTTSFKNHAKPGGFNFAFSVEYGDVRKYAFDRGHSKYGRHCVLFRSSGLRVYHYGDEEYQTIFWGADARDLVLLQQYSGTWRTEEDETGDVLFEHYDLNKVIDWVTQHYKDHHEFFSSRAIAMGSSDGQIPPSLVGHDTDDAFLDAFKQLSQEERDSVLAWIESERDAYYAELVGTNNPTLLYHGSPDRIGRFELKQGRRSGFLGHEKHVKNQGIFLTDSPDIAAYYGSNRSKYGNDYHVYKVYANLGRLLDVGKPPRLPSNLTKLGLRIVNAYDGTKKTRLATRDIWWLLDRQEFVDVLKENYDSIRFHEAPSIYRDAGAHGMTYAVFDPNRLAIRSKDNDPLKTVTDLRRRIG